MRHPPTGRAWCPSLGCGRPDDRTRDGGAVTLRLRYVAGVSPAKWLRAWGERRADLPLEAVRVEQPEQLADLRDRRRRPRVRAPARRHRRPARDRRSGRRLAVAVLPKDHPLADEATLDARRPRGEPLAPAQPDPAMTVELVAAGTGHAILPHGVARLHHRKDVVAIPLTDAAADAHRARLARRARRRRHPGVRRRRARAHGAELARRGRRGGGGAAREGHEGRAGERRAPRRRERQGGKARKRGEGRPPRKRARAGARAHRTGGAR